MNVTNKVPVLQDINLELCPFCGYAAEIHQTGFYGDSAYQIRCTHCRSMSQILAVGQDMFGRVYTHEDALQIVVDRWNKRTASPIEAQNIEVC